MADIDDLSDASRDPHIMDVLAKLPSFFTDDEWLVFFAITSTVICPVSDEGAGSAAEAAFLSHSADILNNSFRAYFLYVLRLLPPESIKGIQYMLNVMSQNDFSPKYVSWTTDGSFHHLPTDARSVLFTKILDGDEATLKFPPLRTFAKTMVKLSLLCWLRTQSKNTTAEAEKVLLPAIGIDYQRESNPEDGIETLGIEKIQSGFLDLAATGDSQSLDGLHRIADLVEDDTEWKVLHTDVVIVGSGAGGGVVAREVALAGHRVLVVEKGEWYPNNELPLPETDAVERMFDGASGLFMSSDTDQVALIAGATFGGGTQVNWGVSLHPQNMVRERDWATKQGLGFFMSEKFQRDIESVCHRIGVRTPTNHNHRNATLLEGARKLGYHAQALPQNSGRHDHADGYCSLGCGGDSENKTYKQGTAQTYLVDAADSGAKFLKNACIERIIIENGEAKGVEGIWTPSSTTNGKKAHPIKIRIMAKKVVLSAGAIQTPVMLLKSQIQNKNIGENLRVHPSILVFAVFPEKTNPLQGASTTAIITEFENLDGDGYGVKIECSSMIPAFFLTLLPWTTPEEWKRKVLQYNNLDVYLSLARDKGCGRVVLGPKGRPRIDYVVSATDRSHVVEGIIGAAKVAYTQGATEIFTSNAALRTFVRNTSDPAANDMGVLNPEFQEWIAEVRKVGLKPPTAGFGSAHQMGSCRMGIDPETSVVDLHGKVWGLEGLHIVDASVLPSATGVNPMVTIMATAQWIARAIVEDM